MLVFQMFATPWLDPTEAERLWPPLAAVPANTDPERFPDPEEVRLDRPPNRHISFSQGIHRCVGATLARAEFSVMLEKVLARMPDYVVDEAAARHNGPSNPVDGWVTMPITFTPGSPTGAP